MAAIYFPLRSPRGLLVEDEHDALLRRVTLMKMKGLDVIAATSKVDALSRLRNIGYRVDVVITDLNLSEEASAEGVDVAGAVFDNSGGTVPVYAYSGKREALPKEQMRLFQDVVLKQSESERIRQVFSKASADAIAHFNQSVERARRILVEPPQKLDPPALTLITDLVAGAVPMAHPFTSIPQAVGFLALNEHGLGVPYGIDERAGLFYADVIGHDYLYSYGETPAEAVEVLEDVLRGFLELPTGGRAEPVGRSRRLHKLLRGLRAYEYGPSGGPVTADSADTVTGSSHVQI